MISGHVWFCVVVSGPVWLLSCGFWPCLVTVRRFPAVFGNCLVISGHGWLLSGLSLFLAVFGYCVVISGRVWLFSGEFSLCLVVVS